MRQLLRVTAFLIVATPLSAQTLEISVSPSSAVIYKLKVQDNSLVPLGTGMARLKLEKNDPNTIVVRQEGFRDERRSYPKDVEYKEKRLSVFLTKRIVQISALPYDAVLYVNGEQRGNRALEVDVEEGQATTVELRKPGWASVKRVYRWEKSGSDLPPARDRLELADRRVVVTLAPSGSELFMDETKLGGTDADVVIPRGSCSTVKAQKAGWIPIERQYCNKEGAPDPPLSDRIPLSGRVVGVTAPEGAGIYVNQKLAGNGTYSVRVPEGQCVTVMVRQPAFIGVAREFCAQENAPPPPMAFSVQLVADESYPASVASDQANVNITLEVAKGKTDEQAWKLLSSIVLSHFDILENSDSETGYLRTAWVIKPFGQNRLIRTRLIVKRVSENPLRYAVKIISEVNRFADVTSAKDDEAFEPWDRILKMYQDVISEMQARLK